MQRDDLPALTGIRGLAALFVVLFHYNIPGFGWGWLSVDAFFILSGFVLSHVYRDGLTRGSFLWVRFARIAPAHVVATGLYCVVFLALGIVTWTKALSAMLLLSVVNPPAWSLTIEVCAYFVFAAVVPLPVARRMPPWLLVLGGAAAGLVGVVMSMHELRVGITFWSFWRGFGWFSCGVGLYRAGWRPRRCWVFDNPVSVWLGDISYPLYLVHCLLRPMALVFPPLLGVAASIGAAVLLYRFVEKPARRWLRALPERIGRMTPAFERGRS